MALIEQKCVTLGPYTSLLFVFSSFLIVSQGHSEADVTEIPMMLMTL